MCYYNVKGVTINMEKFFKNYTINNIQNVTERIKEIEIWNKEFEELKEKLENYFKFEIANYIVSDILECETYNHVCLMINLAVINNRISSENSIILKKELKKLFEIDRIVDRFDKDKHLLNLINQPDD